MQMAFLALLVMAVFPLLTPWEACRDLPASIDSLAQRRSDAAWNIWLSITVIGILLLTAVPLVFSLRKQVLGPIKQVLAILREECPNILDSLHMPEVAFQEA